MATRKNTFLVKRSNIPGKIPSAGDLLLGELALNTADAILYASGTTANSILPIGWDRVARTGDTMTGTLYVPTVSANTISAVTLSFNTTYTGSTPYGTISWNTDFGVPQVGLIGGNVVQKIGESVYAYVKNVDSSTLNKGEVVYIFGASGDKISVKRASNSGDTTSSKTLGVVAESIAVNGLGYVITQGTLDGLNLDSYTDGDIVWLDSTLGQFTKTKQYAPKHLVFIGVVQRANAGNGQLYVKPQNGYELEELHDVMTTGATFGDLLTYSAYNGSNVWVNSKTLNGSYTMTGLTVQGSTSSDLVRITQTGSGNALVVEDDTNPDSSPFIVNASGFVGVGTYNPLSKFVVSNNNSEGIEMGYATGLTSNYLESYNRNTGYGVDMTYYIANTGVHRFYTNGAERVRIDNSGNVGIGTNSPTNRLHIKTATNQNIGFSTGTNGGTISSFNDAGDANVNLAFDASTYKYNISGIEKVRIDSSGNLGVGTSSPSAKLDVSGDTKISNTLSASTLVSTQSSGDEGGDLKLATAATNNTLSGGSITVDIYQNKFRIFESGGSNRGVYIDLTAAATGVGTNLLSGGGGEINTASNLGSGTGLFAQKSAADLQFKSLTSTGGTVTISNTSNTVNLEVVPASNFTGGTVTGATNYTNGLSANTISATTYFNLPNSLTAATYSDGIISFSNSSGGTTNVTASTNYAAGVISGATYSSAGSGQINLPAVKVALYNNANNIEPILIYDVASGTTGSGGITGLTDNDTNYIVIEYNDGSPRYAVYDNDSMVNDSSVVLFMVAYRLGNFVHTLEFGNQGAGLANKLNDRFIMTDRFGYESGLSLSLSASTGIVMATAGVAWNGPNRQTLTAVNSSGSTFFKNYHVGGSWTAETSNTTTGKTINNTYYDNGTDIVAATAGKYLVNWYFRGQEVNSHLYEVYGTSQYDSVALAQLSTEPSLPELITSHAILLGRIIIQVGATTGVTESAFGTVFQSTQVTSHNDLTGLQGGTAGQYYHLTSNQYNNLALTNTNNYFSVGQTVIGTLSASTFTITSIPSNNNNNSQILSRNSTSGDIEYIDVAVLTGATAPSSFNYGIANAMVNFTFLT